MNERDTRIKRRVEDLVARLAGQDMQERWKAASALSVMGASATSAVPALIDLLADPELGDVAAVVLRGIGESAVPALVDVIGDREHSGWDLAVQALDSDCPDAASAIPALVAELGTHARGDAAKLKLGRIGSASLPDLVRVLASGDEWATVRAIEALATIRRPCPAAVQPLTELLRHPDPQTRIAAARALGCIDPEGSLATVLSLLVSLLRSSESVQIRECAAEALGVIGSKACAAIPALIEATHWADSDLRTIAAHALAAMNQRTACAVALPILLAFLDQVTSSTDRCKELPGNKEFLGTRALRAIGSMGDHAQSAVPTIAGHLRSEDLGLEAAKVLAHLGRAGQEVLLDCFQTGEKLARVAIDAFRSLGAAALPLLLTGLGDPRESVRYHSALRLGSLGRYAVCAIAALRDAALRESPRVRRAARIAVKSILHSARRDR